MHANESPKQLVRNAVLAAALLAPGLAFGSDTASTQPAEPMVVAQAGPAGATTTTISPTYPAYQTRVRIAAAESPDALRRYIYRTRMIWNFRFEDYALKN